MSEDASFRDLIRRVRAADAQAATELVGRYEPAIRLVIRRRLTDPGLRRLFDSLDICQSVLASFFVRAAAGQYDLDTSQQLVKLLAVMARNKLANAARKCQTGGRDYQLQQSGDSDQLVDPGPSPSEVVALRELLAKVRDGLTEEERRLADRRALGWTWTEIAAELGGNPDGLRMRLTRALNRVHQELGLEL